MNHPTVLYEMGRTDGFRYERGRLNEIAERSDAVKDSPSYRKGFKLGIADAKAKPVSTRAKRLPKMGIVTTRYTDPIGRISLFADDDDDS